MGPGDDLTVISRERVQRGGGRLDMLLENDDATARYEVEIPLGATDPSHIIRAIEYWDNERKRYPRMGHTAVLVADEITGRFFNVISLLGGSIPIIAIKVSAIQTDQGIALHFAKVLDAVEVAEEGEVLRDEVVDRATWVSKANNSGALEMMDQMLGVLQEIDPSAAPNYVKAYVGSSFGGKNANVITFKPNRRFLRATVYCPETPETTTLIEGLDLVDWEYKRKGYRLQFRPSDIAGFRSELKEIISAAYRHRFAD